MKREDETKKTKCASVAVIGRPSVGKSTLINTICEMKVSITAPTPQTTRNAIRGIYTDQRGQIIFTDTPGYHLGGKEINRRMQEITIASLEESDMVLYLLDGTRSARSEEDAITQILSKIKVPVIAVINKCDILRPEQIEEAEFYLRHKLESATEIIREKTINLLTDELPHVIYVEVADIEYNAEEQSVWVRAFIVTEREGQKGIIVGKGGENIKRIRKESFKEIKRIFPGSSLTLDLRVKAQNKWRNNQVVLDRIFR